MQLLNIIHSVHLSLIESAGMVRRFLAGLAADCLILKFCIFELKRQVLYMCNVNTIMHYFKIGFHFVKKPIFCSKIREK